jgi:hypothetical protein
MKITTVTKAGFAAFAAAGLIAAPAPAASETSATTTRAAACKNISGSPKGAPRADIAVRVCWRAHKLVSWKAYFYPRGVRIGLEASVVRNGVLSTYKSGTRVSYSTARGSYRRVDSLWFKACRAKPGKVFYSCATLR